MLGHCWSDVVDGGPTLAQHRVNASSWLAISLRLSEVPGLVGMPRKKTLTQCWFNVRPVSQTVEHLGPTLNQRLC